VPGVINGRLHNEALSDDILPLLNKIEKILSDKDPICSNAANHDSPALRAATEPGGRAIRFRLAAGLNYKIPSDPQPYLVIVVEQPIFWPDA